MHPAIEKYIQTAALFNETMIKDTAVAVTDLDHYLYYVPGTRINHGVQAGSLIPKGALVEKAMRFREKQVAIVDESVFGFPYVGTAMPIVDEKTKTVVGALFIGENTEEQELIKSMTESITEHIISVNEMAQDMSSKMQSLYERQSHLGRQFMNFNEDLSSVDGFSKVIEGISRQTNMLGINAAIESARIGELGRGFAVVADEIGKLSKQSQDSVTRIRHKTTQIKLGSEELTGHMKEIENISKEIEGAIRRVADNMDHISASIEELSSLTQLK